MQFNPTKCYVMHISSARNPHHQDYTLCNQKLAVANSHPYLGVHLQDDLGWSTHVGHATSKASRMLGVVRRNLYACPEKLKETAYTSLVRPHVEYASVAWDPHQKGNIKKLEKIQRGAARFIKGNYERTEGTVTSLIEQLGWQSLEERRRQARLGFMYKMTNNLVDIPSDRYLTPATRHSRHSNNKSYITHSTRLNIHKYSYFPRTIIQWNALDDTVVNSPTINIFKQQLLLQ
jgi:hypothetical protein